ncbi:MAG: peptidoglycan DD-metalloendopeptidase family protein [Bacteroidales bacterium]
MVFNSIKETITGSLLVLSLLALTAQAQTQRTSNVAPKEMSQLIADQIKINKEKLRVDSLAMLNEYEEEEEDIFFANELYEETWSSTFVNPYGKNISLPDSIRLNCTEWAIPHFGHITSKFGPRRRRYHYGIDLKVQTGDPIYAAFDGKVRIVASAKGGYGKYIVLRHDNGLETVYAHLSEHAVVREQTVMAGDLIGYGGNTGRSTGSHLHFETRILGVPVDPLEIFDFQNKVAHRDIFTFYTRRGRQSSTPYGISFAQTKQSVRNSNVKSTTSTHSSGLATHKVKQGDTLGAIARRHGTTVNNLCKLNNIKPTSTLRLGQTLRIS